MDGFLGLLISLLVFFLPVLVKALNKGASTGEDLGFPAPAPADDDNVVEAEPMLPAPSSSGRAEDLRRATQLSQVAELEARASRLAAEVIIERPNLRFHELLSKGVTELAQQVRAALEAQAPREVARGLRALALIVTEVEELARQRRDPQLLPLLGDADALADSCYRPIIDFARAEGLPLTTAHPATQLADFDLGIWTGFVPTSVAPIFLPPTFFSGLLFWPALGHEIGHSFFASVHGLDQGLRAELGLADQERGSHPLAFDRLDMSELARLFGGWFEELFCDVFGTMMFGPAYVYTMSRLFSTPGQPLGVYRVFLDDQGSYDVHPPPALRIHAGCQLLARLRLAEEGAAIQAEWTARHHVDDAPFRRLLFPLGDRLVALPLEVFEQLTEGLVDRLYTGQFKTLSGYTLRDIPGLDFGIHALHESRRTRDAIKAGRTPPACDARYVISGAVLAWREQPERELQILQAARSAIPALGTLERRPDVYSAPAPAAPRFAGWIDIGPDAVREAFLLGEILARPLPGRRARSFGR